MSLNSADQKIMDDFVKLQKTLTSVACIVRELKKSLADLEKKTAHLMSEENTYMAAEELSAKQIHTLFVAYPWMLYLKLVDKRIITRKEWENARQQSK